MSQQPIHRCGWVSDDPLYLAYHDEEWGVPSFDDRHLFEMISLEGAQAGLSWLTILRKRQGYRRAFAGFDPAEVARFGPEQVEALLADASIVRHRQKIESVIGNAARVLEVVAEHGSLASYLWNFLGNAPRQNRWASLREIPPQTPESKALSKDLLRRGFRFVGPTTIYAFMQAVGMVNDHETGCFRYEAVGKLGAEGPRQP
ncbi:MAG TPA: DNA-3-methyladenine glycosylase I [Thermoanaerobaculia bacterium]|nr:DNA-3-methyladenine glycosylase I [Thermoanaerobaculia bacterium]